METTLTVRSLEQWHIWLRKNHAKETAVWLVFFKKATGRRSVSYEDAVDEALCFGWIDSLVRRLDDDRYCRKFTPRKVNSKWSETNKNRVARLMKAQRMTEAGLSTISFPRTAELNKGPTTIRRTLKLPAPLLQGLKKNRRAWENFTALAPSYRKLYIRWILEAKRNDTRIRRMNQAIRLLARNQKLGLR